MVTSKLLKRPVSHRVAFYGSFSDMGRWGRMCMSVTADLRLGCGALAKVTANAVLTSHAVWGAEIAQW